MILQPRRCETHIARPLPDLRNWLATPPRQCKPSPKKALFKHANFMSGPRMLSKQWSIVGNDPSTRRIRALWRSIASSSNLLSGTSIPASILRKAWPGQRTLPRSWNCRQLIGGNSSAQSQPKPRKCEPYQIGLPLTWLSQLRRRWSAEWNRLARPPKRATTELNRGLGGAGYIRGLGSIASP